MAQNQNIDKNQLDALIKLAGNSLGIDENQLRNAANSGDISSLLTEKNAAKINSVLSNPQVLNKLLSSKKAQSIIKKYTQE